MRTRTTKRTRVNNTKQLPIVTWGQGANAEQMQAIMHGEGPARVLAFAGAGKTRVIIHRVARLVSSGVDPKRILVITFSSKAGEELRTRLSQMNIHGVRAGTFHSVCIEILRTDGTQWASWETRKSTKYELKDVVGFKGMKWDGVDVNKLASFIGLCKAHMIEADDTEGCTRIASGNGREALLARHEISRAQRAYHLYQERLAEKQILTFDDYLVNAVKHLSNDENARQSWAAKWDYVIADEAQDTNPVQNILVNMFARDHRNYMVVGDFFQCLYAFRAAVPQILANFDKEWPGCVNYVLPRNYRSGRKIISAANGIVSHARVDGIEPTPMIGERDFDGVVSARSAEDFDDEAHAFAGWVANAVKAGDRSYADHCALFRVNAQSRALEEALISARIPYVVVGGLSFYESKEVRDLLAYLRVSAGRGELEDVKRCINAPFRFLGAAFVSRVVEAVEDMDERGARLDWGALVRDVADGQGIQSRQRGSAEAWAGLIATAAKRIAAAKVATNTTTKEEARPALILEDIIRATRYIEWIQKEEGEESLETSGAANVREMCRVSERFPSVDELIDYVDETIRASKRQREDKQAGGDRVILMSIFKSKGLEFPRVWISGFNEDVMPHSRGELEEERRVAYVAATRARDEMVFSYVRTMATRAGIRDAHPSRFLTDANIDGDHNDEDDPDGDDLINLSTTSPTMTITGIINLSTTSPTMTITGITGTTSVEDDTLN